MAQKSTPDPKPEDVTTEQHLRNLNEPVEISSGELLAYIESKRIKYTFITVTFISLDNEIFTQTYASNISIGEIKQILENIFNTPSTNILLLSCENVEVSDDVYLDSFDLGIYKRITLYIRSKDPKKIISAKTAYRDITVPDIIYVTITFDDGHVEHTTIEIENQSIIKPFLGGYVHNVTQIEYHHGYTQTGPPVKKDAVKKTHRDTQTYDMRNRKQNTGFSQATQMTNTEIYIPNVNDTILTAGKYETAAEREKRLAVVKKIETIQRYYRAWKMRCALKELSDEYKKRIRLEKEEEETAQRIEVNRRKKALIGKIFPKTKADFFMLYTMLDTWKKSEIERIKLMACGPSKLAEMYILLEKEIQMLLMIDKQKEMVKKDRRINKDIEFLKTISEPLSWNSPYKNLPVEMDTLETQKGREYYEIYKKLCNRELNKEERFQLYLDIKLSLKDHNNCEVGLELVHLIDRMCILMSRGITESHLEILQKRIEACYLQHLRLKECCENVSLRQARVKEKLMKKHLFFCERCKTFKTQDCFNIETNTKNLIVCSACHWNDRVMEPWTDIQPFSYLLKCIRREERRQSSKSSIAFILTDKEINRIVTSVWQSHSAISEVGDMYKLRLCRFFKDCDWAPWNCILLTYEESRAHLNIINLQDVYDQEFLKQVYAKHMLCKRLFKGAIQLYNYFEDVGNIERRWDEIIETKEFIAVNSKTKVFLSCH